MGVYRDTWGQIGVIICGEGLLPVLEFVGTVWALALGYLSRTQVVGCLPLRVIAPQTLNPEN